MLTFVAVRLPAAGWSLYAVCLGREVARGALWWAQREVWA